MYSHLEKRELFDREQIDLLRDALDESELAAMMAELPRAAEEGRAAIEIATASKDMEEVRRAAHALKGVAGSFGAARLADIAREIELELSSLADVTQMLPFLRRTVEQTAASLPGTDDGYPDGQ